MNRLRDPRWMLIFLFLGIITIVPLVQLVRGFFQENESGVSFELFNESPISANLRAYEKSSESANWAARLSRPLLQFAHFKWLKDGGEKVLIGSSGWYFYKPGIHYMLARPELVEAAIATNNPTPAIVHFRDQLAERGIRLLLVPVPNKESIYPDKVSSRAENLNGVMAPRTRQVLDKLRAHGVEVLDLFELFRASRQKSNNAAEPPLYLAQDTHWSPRGMDLAAKAAAHRLIELGWIAPGKTQYREKEARVARLGDLVHMLQSPMLEQATQPENIVASQIVGASDGKLYQDQSEAEILVIGDSFLRIYQQDAPTSAGFIAHLAKELSQPMMSIVNDGGGSTLVREELSSRPIFLKNKKVVVWEFVERDLGLGIKGWQRTSLPAVSDSSPQADSSRTEKAPNNP
jgi:hypothetical protein